jgi:molybdate transport system regulatory protein
MPRARLHLDQALGHAATDKRLEILRGVGECGSISQAAREAGVSYKAAWQALDMLSNLAGLPLVERAVGGAGGGGAHLTPAGEQVLRAGAAMARTREKVLSGLSGLALRTSMRNQLPATVARLEASGPLMRVELALAGGGALAARITSESAELLGLRADLPVLALCKATSVTVARPGTRKPAGANRLEGRATRVARGDAGDEVSVLVPGGLAMVGFAAARSGLRAGSVVTLRVDESAVVIALGD